MSRLILLKVVRSQDTYLNWDYNENNLFVPDLAQTLDAPEDV